MVKGNFYFIKDCYFEKFSDCKLLHNKEIIAGDEHNRPCYYAFPDEEDKRICWMVPVTSKIEKFERKYQKSIERYGICDVVSFGYLNGNKNAFAIQNMCPVTEKYILNEYINSNTNCPVFIPNDLKREINAKVRKIIRLHKKGVSLAFADIISMREVLLKELDLEESE